MKTPLLLPVIMSLSTFVHSAPVGDVGDSNLPADHCTEAMVWKNRKPHPIPKETRQHAVTLAGMLLESSTDRSRQLIEENTWAKDSAKFLSLEIKFDRPIQFDPPSRPGTRLSSMLVVMEAGKERIYANTADGILSPFIALDPEVIAKLKIWLQEFDQ